MPTVTRTTEKKAQDNWKRVQTTSSHPPSISEGVADSMYEYKKRTWVRDPNFREKRRTRSLPTNPYSLDSIRASRTYGVIVSTAKYFPWQNNNHSVTKTSGCLNNFFPSPVQAQYEPPGDTVNILYRTAVNDLLSKLKDKKVDISAAIAERNQTLGMLARIVTSLATTARRLKKFDYTGAARALGLSSTTFLADKLNNLPKRRRKKWHRELTQAVQAGEKRVDQAVANAWLSLNFGIKPLVADVKGLAEELAKADFHKVTGKARASATATIHDVKNSTLGGYPCKVFITHTVTVSVGCSWEATGKLHPSVVSTSILNIPSAAWETIPWSWAFDYILPIGQWLSNIDATLGMSFKSGFTNTKVTTSEIYVVDVTIDSVSEHKRIYCSANVVQDKIRREPMSAFPSGLGNFPRVKNPCSVDHVLNALAVLNQALSHGKR